MHSINYLSDQMFFTSAEVARLAGVHKDTLLRWLRAGAVAEPKRDRHGWRRFTKVEAESIAALAKSFETEAPPEPASQRQLGREERLATLGRIDWDFSEAKTNYLTHGIHPYPAKFIPQIPNALIQELSSVGDVVGDIFCGSGTTLVEALTLKRHAVGIDANPLACLLSRAKTTTLTAAGAAALAELRDETRTLGDKLASAVENNLLVQEPFRSREWRPAYEKLNFWFQQEAIEELAEIRSRCVALAESAARELALIALSSIVVTVSRQDSDTRYVRREKDLKPGDTFKKFSRALDQCLHSATEFTEFIETRFRCTVRQATLLDRPETPMLDLMVCSPPYPNAYSYHLYHMTRMLWLEMDQPKFKRDEIGSHRKYSSTSKNAATVDTFRSEFTLILDWLAKHLKPGGYACFVVGDSTLRGERICNADLIAESGRPAGFVEVARLSRTMQASKKSFNPAIGRIKTEDILILQNMGYAK